MYRAYQSIVINTQPCTFIVLGIIDPPFQERQWSTLDLLEPGQFTFSYGVH